MLSGLGGSKCRDLAATRGGDLFSTDGGWDVGRIKGIFACLVLTIGTFFIKVLLLATCDPRVRPIMRPMRSYVKLAFPVFLVVGLYFLVF